MIDQEKLAEIQNLAHSLLSPQEIAIVVQMPVAEFLSELKNPDSPIFLAYKTGNLKAKAELNKAILELAKAGSSPAQTLVLKLLEKTNANEVKN